MNNKMICSKCKKRPAVIFVSRVDGDKTTQEGYCIKCATELNIGPIKQMMQSMGITEDDIEAVSEQFGDMMENMEDFQLGGAGTMPFMQNFLANMNGSSPDAEDSEEGDVPGAPEEKKSRFGKKKKKQHVAPLAGVYGGVWGGVAS